MNYNELCEKLKQLRTEEIIWIVYIGIIIMSFYSNYLERKYFIYNDVNSKENYRKMLIIIFSILIVVYIYFLKTSIDDVRSLKPNDSEQKKRLTFLSLIGSLFIAASGAIFLYIAIMDQEIDIELAFN